MTNNATTQVNPGFAEKDMLAAAEAVALGDKLLGEGSGQDEGVGEDLAPAEPEGGTPAGAGVVVRGKDGAANLDDGVEGESHNADNTAGGVDGKVPEESPEEDILRVLQGRSEKVRARNEARRIEQLEENLARAEQAAKRALDMDALRRDPLAVLRQAGITEEQLAQRLLGETEKPESRVESRIERLERLLQERSERDRKAEESAKAAELQRSTETVKRSFVGFVANNIQQFPHLEAHYDAEPEALASEALRIADAYKERTGRDTTFEAVAKFLESGLATRYNKLVQRQQPKVTSEADQAPGQRTLTPTDTAKRGSVPRKDPKDMTQDEAEKEALRMANQLVRETRRR